MVLLQYPLPVGGGFEMDINRPQLGAEAKASEALDTVAEIKAELVVSDSNTDVYSKQAPRIVVYKEQQKQG